MKYQRLVLPAHVLWTAILLSGCAFSGIPQSALPIASMPLAPLATKPCPKPAQVQTGKDMPAFIASLPLCHVDNMELLLIRDTRLRQYINALEATILCYEGTLQPTIH